MRFILGIFAAVMIAAAPAHATENRLTVTDIHNFVGQASSAINNPNMNVARIFFNTAAAENAVFANNVTRFNGYAYYNYADPWHRVWYNDPYYGTYYRYPVNPYYNRTSTHTQHKQAFIAAIEGKKSRIPGYEVHMAITDTTINSYASAAVIDVDLKEYGMTYTPHSPTLATRVMHANSKCKMYISRMGETDMVLTRMDCNTNSNLPF